MSLGTQYGLTKIAGSGRQLDVKASNDADWMPIGCTLNWSLFPQNGGTPTTSSAAEGTPIPANAYWARYGQVIARQITQAVQVLTQTGASTLTAYDPAQDVQSTRTYALGAGANTAAVQAAMDALYGAGNTIVTGTGPFTITFQGSLIGYKIPTITATTGATLSVTQQGGIYGDFGPFDSAVSDGRQTLTRGNCAILNRTILAAGVLGFTLKETVHVGALIGGTMWRDRIIATSGTHSLANGPTWTELEAALPGLKYAGF